MDDDHFKRRISLRPSSKQKHKQIFDQFANQAIFLPPLDFNELKKGEQISNKNWIVILQRMEQYAQSNKRMWQGALPKTFRNYYLELSNDRQNAFRSERVNKLIDQKLVRKVENFLDLVVQSNGKEDLRAGTQTSFKLQSGSVQKRNFRGVLQSNEQYRQEEFQMQILNINQHIIEQERADNISVKYIGIYEDEIGILSRKTPFSKDKQGSGRLKYRSESQQIQQTLNSPISKEAPSNERANELPPKYNSIKRRGIQTHKDEYARKLTYNEYSFVKLMQNNSLPLNESALSISHEDSLQQSRPVEIRDLKESSKIIPQPQLYDSFLVNRYLIPRRLKVYKKRTQQRLSPINNEMILKQFNL